MKIDIPPHIGWPLLIVAFLLMSVGVSVTALLLAGADGGAQVIDDYYQKGVNWEETAVERAASRALGWQISLDVLEQEEEVPGLRRLEVRVIDREGQAVQGLHGVVRLFRPQTVEAVAEMPVLPVTGQNGLYSQLVPIGTDGIWDFELRLEREGQVFTDRIRKRLRN